MKTALIAGSTGLIGSQVLALLLASDQYDKVITFTRKLLTGHPKLLQVQIHQGKLTFDPTWHIDDVFCCLGTTMAKVRSKEKFYEVDFNYPLLLAKNSIAAGAKQYLLVSALGANKKSPVFYNQVKGEIEEAILRVGFETVHIFRPSLLLGPRQEKRSAEDAAKFFYKVFGFLIPPKFKAIEAIKVARAMLHFAVKNQKGNFIHESTEMQDF
ncbi:NAD-dependent epimerase/dehydratase family protein [Chryseolinea sp. H1M3-3]|uniref:NAD-dependent epimerase/dehydratase family protein n=1 Tax=Chryseolinea sp. H1M3-3 TaxID=3034144 RepID=UPI0023EBCF3F|nr:NAD-dependent epimerase/dehydratase family protein [Chryseolinea sp. H1M3-3]